MKKLLLINAMLGGLVACSSLDSVFQSTGTTNMQDDSEYSILSASQQIKQDYRHDLTVKPDVEYQRNNPNNNINTHMRGLMQDLISNLQYINETTPVAVTSFVLLDSDFQTGNLLGNQMTESLMHELHKFGIPVVDYKSTGYIRVTEQGDFALTKDYTDLTEELPIKYLLTGTMVKHRNGYLINARFVGVKSKAIVGTAQRFIPSDIADSLISSIEDDEDSNMADENKQVGIELAFQ
ncbi:FlgO family outer membrane protein [Alteromonadaceae bacterium BrNp21-10]|nr:FlgO family outer membrane protein [Alteromonadaceae bacterium BrNp21-10]